MFFRSSHVSRAVRLELVGSARQGGGRRQAARGLVVVVLLNNILRNGRKGGVGGGSGDSIIIRFMFKNTFALWGREGRRGVELNGFIWRLRTYQQDPDRSIDLSFSNQVANVTRVRQR